MTIESVYTPLQYSIAGVSYPITWELLGADNVVVVIDGVVLNPSRYTVTLTGSGPVYTGGTVEFDEEPEGFLLTISRNTRISQEILYSRYTAFPAKDNEFGLDKLTMVLQEVNDGGIGSGTFLPLDGGTMSPGATIKFVDPIVGSGGDLTFTNVFGVSTFVLSPSDFSIGGSAGYSFLVKTGTGLIIDDEGSIRFVGRLPIEQLPDDAIALKGDLESANSLPLAGGQMNPGAVITFEDSVTGTLGQLTFDNVFGTSTFALSPVDPANDEAGFALTVKSGVGLVIASTGVATLEGRPALETLPDDAIALKGDLESSTALQLAGGQMDEGASIDWIDPVTGYVGQFTFGNLAGASLFTWGPTDLVAGMNIGYIWGVKTGVSMGLSIDGVLSLQGRPAYSTLGDEDVVVKLDLTNNFLPLAGGTLDEGAALLFTKPTASTTGANARINMLNALGLAAFTIEPDETAQQEIAFNFITRDNTGANVQGNSGGWVIRNQQVTNDDSIITLGYLNAEGYLKPDAPSDGNEYVRKDGAWVISTGGGGGVPEVPDTPAGQKYVREFGAWTPASDAGVVEWGTISGTLSAQADLNAALNGKLGNSGTNIIAANAVYQFTKPGGDAGGNLQMKLVSVLGASVFQLVPDGAGNGTIAYSLSTRNTPGAPTFEGNVSSGFEIANQVVSTNESIVTLGYLNSRNFLTSVGFSNLTGAARDNANLNAELNLKLDNNAPGDQVYGRQGNSWVPVNISGDFLPLAGGTMNPLAQVRWSSAGVVGLMQFYNYFGQQSFYLGPDAGQSVGVVLGTSLGGPQLLGSPVAGWTVTNQVFSGNDNIATVGFVNTGLAGKANTNTVVTLTGTQTISGAKTFSSPISALAGINANSNKISNLANGTANGDAVNFGQLSAKANTTTVNTLDAQNVKLTTTQTISGQKTFSANVTLSAGTTLAGGQAHQLLNPAGTTATTWRITVNNLLGQPQLQIAPNNDSTNGSFVLQTSSLAGRPSLTGDKVNGITVASQVFDSPNAVVTRAYVEANFAPL